MKLEDLLKRLIEIYKQKGNIEVCAMLSNELDGSIESFKIKDVTLPDNSYDKEVSINLKEI